MKSRFNTVIGLTAGLAIGYAAGKNANNTEERPTAPHAKSNKIDDVRAKQKTIVMEKACPACPVCSACPECQEGPVYPVCQVCPTAKEIRLITESIIKRARDEFEACQEDGFISYTDCGIYPDEELPVEIAEECDITQCQQAGADEMKCEKDIRLKCAAALKKLGPRNECFEQANAYEDDCMERLSGDSQYAEALALDLAESIQDAEEGDFNSKSLYVFQTFFPLFTDHEGSPKQRMVQDFLRRKGISNVRFLKVFLKGAQEYYAMRLKDTESNKRPFVRPIDEFIRSLGIKIGENGTLEFDDIPTIFRE